MRSGTIQPPAEPTDVREMMDHAAWYFPADRVSAFELIRSSQAVVPLSELRCDDASRTLDTCATLLAAAGIRVALVDVSSADMVTSPFRVMRAVSPDLQALSYGHGLDHPPVERIQQLGGPQTVQPEIHPIW